MEITFTNDQVFLNGQDVTQHVREVLNDQFVDHARTNFRLIVNGKLWSYYRSRSHLYDDVQKLRNIGITDIMCEQEWELVKTVWREENI